MFRALSECCSIQLQCECALCVNGTVWFFRRGALATEVALRLLSAAGFILFGEIKSTPKRRILFSKRILAHTKAYGSIRDALLVCLILNYTMSGSF